MAPRALHPPSSKADTRGSQRDAERKRKRKGVSIGQMRRFLLLLALLLVPHVLLAHGGLRDLKGTIAKVSADSIVVTHTDGKTNETVPLTSATVYKVGSA